MNPRYLIWASLLLSITADVEVLICNEERSVIVHDPHLDIRVEHQCYSDCATDCSDMRNETMITQCFPAGKFLCLQFWGQHCWVYKYTRKPTGVPYRIRYCNSWVRATYISLLSIDVPIREGSLIRYGNKTLRMDLKPLNLNLWEWAVIESGNFTTMWPTVRDNMIVYRDYHFSGDVKHSWDMIKDLCTFNYEKPNCPNMISIHHMMHNSTVYLGGYKSTFLPKDQGGGLIWVKVTKDIDGFVVRGNAMLKISAELNYDEDGLFSIQFSCDGYEGQIYGLCGPGLPVVIDCGYVEKISYVRIYETGNFRTCIFIVTGDSLVVRVGNGSSIYHDWDTDTTNDEGDLIETVEVSDSGAGSFSFVSDALKLMHEFNLIEKFAALICLLIAIILLILWCIKNGYFSRNKNKRGKKAFKHELKEMHEMIDMLKDNIKSKTDSEQNGESLNMHALKGVSREPSLGPHTVLSMGTDSHSVIFRAYTAISESSSIGPG